MEKPAAAARPEKIPAMQKDEYDALIRRGILARIAFSGTEHPYIAPFMYVFDEHNLYFLSTRYGRKMDLFAKNPAVSVEIEEVAPDMSAY
ncbi:MAG TPA: pyridoxamine 5'-phosphate oxidase family protein, partial [Methanocorpusculum sp.]|nr:pyridoxamine 5'-phosphate oxidase family protein [Methanocorpusculum sp.]